MHRTALTRVVALTGAAATAVALSACSGGGGTPSATADMPIGAVDLS